MSLELWTTVTVECSHAMPVHLGVSAVHGHSYWLQFFVASSPTDPTPLPKLQAEAQRFAAWFDHGHLNDCIPVPTMEAMAEYIADRWRGPLLTRIIVRRDSLGCGVEWRPC